MPKGESSAGARLWKPAQRGKGGIAYDIQIQKRGKDGNISRTRNPPSGAKPPLSVEGSAFALLSKL